MMRETTKSTRKRKNRTWAMPAEAVAMPPKPNTAAIIATTKKIRAQLSILRVLLKQNWWKNAV
jgi:hypothetical protein